MTLSFSGHETFHCRQFWLKKGYDFICNQANFNDGYAVVHLGVGRNMVNSIRYWLRVFGMAQDDRPTDLAHDIFGEHGKDPYLENIGTLWLLHYSLIKNQKASIYSLVFNQFRKERLEFTKEQLLGFLKRKCEEVALTISPTTLQNDMDIFIRTYLRSKSKQKDIEDDFMSLFIDLQLLQEVDHAKLGGAVHYKIQDMARENLPTEIVLYTILDQTQGVSISFNQLLNEDNNVGMVYALSANGLMKHINVMVKQFPQIIFSDDAGVRELQFRERLDKQTILDRYYAQ